MSRIYDLWTASWKESSPEPGKGKPKPVKEAESPRPPEPVTEPSPFGDTEDGDGRD